MTWTSSLAEQVGASEDGLKLILGQLAGYPLMLVHRAFLADKPANLQHVYFILTGLLASHWVIGNDAVHSLYCIFGTYLLLLLAGGTLLSVVVSFVFNLGYLLLGYYYTFSDNYDISWTMPHCVLCLRLIGLTFDCYDGARAKEKGLEVLSKDQQKVALAERPSILEVLSHSFFIGSHFMGPQISMRQYQKLFAPVGDKDKDMPSPIVPGFKRLGVGILYMTFHVVGAMFIPEMWPGSEHFATSPLLVKLGLLPIWVKVVLSKYISAWLMAEGVCIISGLSYTGKGKNGQPDFSGCANVKLSRLETSQKFGHIIESFNINTNAWVAAYVYKRLKFLGNRDVSQVATLLFLAVWHGFHSGYYVTFLIEFMVMKVERDVSGWMARSDRVAGWLKYPAFDGIGKILGYLYVNLLLPHCFLPFGLLKFNRYYSSFMSMYFCYFILYGVYFASSGLIRRYLDPKPVKKD